MVKYMINDTKRQLQLNKAREYQRIRRQNPEYREQQRLYQAKLRQDEFRNAANRQDQAKRRKLKGCLTKTELLVLHSTRFLARAAAIHGNKYNYSKTKYTSSNQKVIITCPTHGDFNQTPTAHISGKQGCPACATIARKLYTSSTKLTQQQFVTRATEKHAGKYNYTNTIYTKLNAKIIVDCPDHGPFTQEAKAHLRGQGCPMCANERRLTFFQSKGEQEIERYLHQRGIQYEPQKTFVDCIFKNHLRYDFFVPSKNLLIEFDGAQHFEFVKKFHKTVENFETFKKRDQVKNEYAASHNINLLRIKYDQQHAIPAILSSYF